MNKYILSIILFMSPVVHAQSIDDHCKAITIFKEASIEPIAGQRAVLDVVRNRIKHRKLTACEVVQQPKQFSFVTEEMSWQADKSQLKLLQKVRNFPKVLDSSYRWFYHKSIQPKWANNMNCILIGSHKFCKRE